MSAILLISPKRAANETEGVFSAFRQVMDQRVQNFFGQNIDDKPAWIIPPSAGIAPLLALWQSKSSTGDLYKQVDSQWATATDSFAADKILENFNTLAGSLKLEGATWGSYMAIHGAGSTNRITAWNTASSIEAVHYSETSKYFYVSNRPALISMAMSALEFKSIELEENYALECLHYGFSVGSYTPFREVLTVPPRMALSIVGDHAGLIHAPVLPDFELEQHDTPFRTGTKELVEAMENSVERLIKSRSSNDLQLRLSGGIDSRILLGLLKNYSQLNITAVTHGDADSEEVQVASELADLAKVNHIVSSPSLVDQRGGYESMLGAIAEGQGFIPSEALTAPYSSADTLVLGEGLAAGQWPIFKGVYERLAKTTYKTTSEFFQKIESGILSDQQSDRVRSSIRQWLAITPAMRPREVLYLYGRDIRASKYLQPEAVRTGQTALPFYPFLDSQVVAVADRLPEANRRSQFTSFFALESLWPAALSVPLAGGGRFKFEKNEPFQGISGESYHLRTSTPRPYQGNVLDRLNLGALPDPKFFTSARTSAAKLIRESAFWAQKSDWFSLDFRELVESFALADDDNQLEHRLRSRAERKRVHLVFWRVLLVAIWYEGNWINR